MFTSAANGIKNFCYRYDKFFNSLSLHISNLFSGKKGWVSIIVLNVLFIICGSFLVIFASDIGPALGKKSWDSLIFYHDQFLFIGRLFFFMAGIGDLGFYLFKRGIPLSKNLFVCALAFGIALQLDSYCRRTFWNDTIALALYLKQFSLQELHLPGHPNPFMQMGPPGFIVLSKMTGECLGFNKWSLAFPVLLFSLSSLWAFKRFACKILPPWGSVAAMWLFVLNPGVWIYAGEFKQYCCDIFFTIVILSVAADYMQNEKKYWKQLFLIGITALLFSHAMFFVLPAVGVALFINYLRGHKHYSLFIIGAVWGSAVLAMAYYTKVMMPSGMYIHEHHIKGFAPIPDSLENIKWYWTSLTSLFVAPWGMAWNTFLFIFPCCGMVIGIKKLWEKQSGFILACAGILLLLYTASFFHQYSLVSGIPFPKGRLILFTIPPAILLFCGSLKYKVSSFLAIPVALSILLHCCTAMIPFNKPEDAVEDLLLRYKDGDQILATDNIAKVAVLLYAPENIAAKSQFFEIDEFQKLSHSAKYVHILLADCPPDQLPIPPGYIVKRSNAFAFTTVITLQRKDK